MDDRPALRATRRPSVVVAWLQWRNLWRRWPRAAAVFTVAFLALGLLGRIRAVEYLMALSALSARFVVTLSAMLAAILTLRRGGRLSHQRHHDWLAALPRNLPIALRSSVGPLAVLLFGAALVLVLSLGGQWPAWIVLRLIGSIAAGSALGAGLGAAVVIGHARPGRSGGSRAYAQPRSHYVLARPARVGPMRATLLPLGAWPVAEARFRDRPAIRARSLILLLLAVPIGVSGGAVLAAAAAWLMVLHLVNLTRAVLRTAFSAGRWLAPTAPDPLRFTWALTHRVFAAQALSAALLLAIVAVTRAASDLRLAGLIVSGCLAVALVLAATGSLLALRSGASAASILSRWGR
ncbi:MAG: hypothetical protein ACP5P4_06675 [Steroidobacteraceae bacterium]